MAAVGPAGYRTNARLWQTIVILAICAIGICVAAETCWLTMGLLALGAGPIPRVYLINLICFVGFTISAITLWKWPWIAVFVAWANMLSILTRFTPWEDSSLATFFSQFVFDHLFFIAANVGAFAVISTRHVRAEESEARPLSPAL